MPWVLAFFPFLCIILVSREESVASAPNVMCKNDKCSEQLFQAKVTTNASIADGRFLTLQVDSQVSIFGIGPQGYWIGKFANHSGLIDPRYLDHEPLTDFLEANYKNEMCLLRQVSSGENATVELVPSLEFQFSRNVTIADYLEDEEAANSILISEKIKQKHAQLKNKTMMDSKSPIHGQSPDVQSEREAAHRAPVAHQTPLPHVEHGNKRHLPADNFESTIKRNGTERHQTPSGDVVQSEGPSSATVHSKATHSEQHRVHEKMAVMRDVGMDKNAKPSDPKLPVYSGPSVKKATDMPEIVPPMETEAVPKTLLEENKSKPEEQSIKGEKVKIPSTLEKRPAEDVDSNLPILNDSKTEEVAATSKDKLVSKLSGSKTGQEEHVDQKEVHSFVPSPGGSGSTQAGAIAVPSQTGAPVTDFRREKVAPSQSPSAVARELEAGNLPTLSKKGHVKKLDISQKTCPRKWSYGDLSEVSAGTEDVKYDGTVTADNRSKEANIPDRKVDELPEDTPREDDVLHSSGQILPPPHAENADAQACFLDPDACPSEPIRQETPVQRKKEHSGWSKSLPATIGKRLVEYLLMACSFLSAQVSAAIPSSWKQSADTYELVLVTLTALSLLVYVADCSLAKECKRRAFASSIDVVERHVDRLVSACEHEASESTAQRNTIDELARKEEEKNELAERVRNLEIELSSYKEANDFLEGDLSKMVKENAELKEKMAYARDIQKTNANLEETLRLKVEQIERLEEERARDVGIMDDLRKSSEDERKQRIHFSEEVERLKGKIAKLGNSNSALLKEKADMEEQLRTMELESNGLKEMVAKVAPSSRSGDRPAEGGDWTNEDFTILSSVELWEQIVDSSRLHGLIGRLNEETTELKTALTKEEEGRKALEGEMERLRVERDEMKTAVQQAEMQTMEAATRLKILEEFFEARQKEMQKQLGMQMSLSQQQTEQLESREDQMKGHSKLAVIVAIVHSNSEYKEEKEHMEQMLTEVRAEVKDLVKENKRQRLSLERAAQEAWLSSKRHERELEALRLENSNLRTQLMSYDGVVPNAVSVDPSAMNNLSVPPPLFTAMPPQACLTLPPLPPLPLIPDELCSPELEGSLEGAEFNSFNSLSNHQWNEWDRSDDCGRRSRNLHINGRYSNSSSPPFMGGDPMPKGRSSRHKRVGNGEANSLSAKGESRYRLSAERRDMRGEAGSSDPSCETDTSATSPPFLAAAGVPVPMARNLPYRPKTIRK
ncbi:hypothetical protein D918_04495 [Trichuris suis]|nr:hypothetical protein D918_04495 [Trichuris suis]